MQMLKRKAYDKLISWHKESHRKALCIIGARQVGKTTLVRAFAQEYYKNYIELNFLTDPDAKTIFDGRLDVQTILINLTTYTHKEAIPGKTLIFLDEIQECPQARTAIKFLVDDGRFDYIESGSQLGAQYKKIPSYPVGYEEIYYMYPLDFREFLWANEVPQATFDYLEECFRTLQPVSDSVHETMLRLFETYIVVGGMPAAVREFVSSHDMTRVISDQNDIIELYRQDITQYVEGNDKVKVRAIFDSIPAQLNDHNRRFILTSLEDKARIKRYENSFRWLSDAGVALPSYNVTEPAAPLELNARRNLFKLYMADTGLLCAMSMNDVQYAILQGDLDVNLGSILENVFAQQLTAKGFGLHYFDQKKFGELDFVVQAGTEIDILEIKSGNNYHNHPSITKVSAVENWKFRNKIIFCKGNVSQEGDIVYLPWYEVLFYRSNPPRQEHIVNLDLSALPGASV